MQIKYVFCFQPTANFIFAGVINFGERECAFSCVNEIPFFKSLV